MRDEATGELREPTRDELAALTAGLDPRLTRGRQGLQGVRNADGSWTLELGGRIVAASFGRIGADGSVAVVCTHGEAPPAAPPDSGEAVR